MRARTPASAPVRVSDVPLSTPIKPYGDGTELDDFEDLPVSKELEKQRVVRPISRKSSGASIATAKSSSLGRKAGVKVASSLGQSDAAPPSNSSRIDDHGRSNAKTGEPERKKLERRREPHLIRHLGGNATVKGKQFLLCVNVVSLRTHAGTLWRSQGEMTYNPVLQRWQGKELILRDFDKVLATSVRPALISPLSATLLSPSRPSSGSARFAESAQAGQVRASGAVPPDAGASRASAKVVGGMVFDPATCSWHALAGPDAEEELELDCGRGRPTARMPTTKPLAVTSRANSTAGNSASDSGCCRAGQASCLTTAAGVTTQAVKRSIRSNARRARSGGSGARARRRKSGVV